MHPRTKSFCLIALDRCFRAAFSSARAEDLASVLAKLDAAAKNFHTTTASFEFDTVQTDPIPDTDKLTGTAYYQRQGSALPDGRSHLQAQ